MRQSHLFTKTRKSAPKDEVSKNAELLIRGGFIHKEMAGVYAFLPLGLRVFNNVENIIREEMNSIGGQELHLTALQPKDLWVKTERWSDEVIDVWFKTKLQNGTEIGLATTHEEPITNLMIEHIRSHKDLPVYAYQFQTKFRNELRARSGIMRSREFVMKDLYSFNKDEESFRRFYEEAAAAYLRIYSRVGIGNETYRTFASGGSFSKFSDEFQTVSDAGEDTIYVDEERKLAINEEVFNDEVIAELGLDKDKLIQKRAVEVGNIFPLSTRYSEAIGLYYSDENGEKKPVVMGCYGIGPARLMGTIVELLSDEDGLVWPESIAPFRAHLILVNAKSPEQTKVAEDLYRALSERGVEVLYDDRETQAGEKFADSDLIGIPHRITVGKRALENGLLEYTNRETGETKELDKNELFDLLTK